MASVFEQLDCTRQRCVDQRDVIAERLVLYERLLGDALAHTIAETACKGFLEDTLSEEERDKWERTREMVTCVLPQLLEELDDKIADNSSRIRGVRHNMEEIRAQRLAIREQVALKQEEIALALQN